jgi:2,3-bisphosphoglycerate-independent phosphoglycerate mutase
MLCILDGWGLSDNQTANAVVLGNTPNFDRLYNEWPHTQLIASGTDVGLPAGVMGNSEVGHLNLGAGRIVWQDSSLIDQSIRDGSFFENETLLKAIEQVQQNNSRLHLIGLVSDGNVHSSQGHYLALLELAARRGLTDTKVLLHAFTDGRDVGPQTAKTHLARVVEKMIATGTGRIASIVGRYFAMDRDNRWARVKQAYELLTEAKGHTAPDAFAAIDAAYARGETDEFIEATAILDQDGKPLPRIADGDSVIFFNYRSDRGRELTRVFIDADFEKEIAAENDPERTRFVRAARPKVLFSTMTRYASDLQTPIAFEPRPQRNGLGEIVAAHGKTQLRIAETEKYPHVTYFFSGGMEQPWPGEERILVASPNVATYDLQPEMSAPEVTKKVTAAINGGWFDLVILNFANPDMVGHTGSLPAAIKAVETIDAMLGKVLLAIDAAGGALLVIADHGNCEQMLDPQTGKPHTAHTTNLVPCILYGENLQYEKLRGGGRLADVAPTLLDLMQIRQPDEMTGHSLLGASEENPVDHGSVNNDETAAVRRRLHRLEQFTAGLITHKSTFSENEIAQVWQVLQGEFVE